MYLPPSSNLNLEPLKQGFRKTSTTYKFHWFLAILESIEEGNFAPTKEMLFIKMYGLAVSSNYLHLSFGKQDKIPDKSSEIFANRELPQDASRREFEAALNEFWDYETGKLLFHFDKSVPHWFLSPWISNKNKTQIYSESQGFKNQSLYALYKEFIEINPLWKNYLENNYLFLKAFCYDALAEYLRKKNPGTEISGLELPDPKEESFYSSQSANRH